ncbi:MAG: hypothetical protein U5Q03_01125 [Bacteroidota bacterium]|nr:hypothetical protein [Bacteroidota bacterium]
MSDQIPITVIESFLKEFRGEFHTGLKYRLLYATDASAYREIPWQ